MKEKYKDETFLARWIANELSVEELEEFQKTDEYLQFKAINEASQFLKAPSYDKETVLSKIKSKTLQSNKKVVKLVPSWVYGAVASIALLVSFFVFNTNSNNNNLTTFATNYGEQTTVVLPDNSKVYLSPKSEISFYKEQWNNNRKLNLNGEAYFEVEKGKTFTVNSTEGSVTVLGTKFTVNTTKNCFEVICYKGKVKVITTNNKNVILTKGKAFRNFNNLVEKWNLTDNQPTWINGETTFNNAPLSQVIKALENQFNIKFDTSKIKTTQRFTGTFTHDDVNIALQTVFAPMKISYKLAENSTVVLTYSK